MPLISLDQVNPGQHNFLNLISYIMKAENALLTVSALTPIRKYSLSHVQSILSSIWMKRRLPGSNLDNVFKA
jgi:hypothetical protein